MDPLNLIMAALVAGLTAGLKDSTQDLVKKAYEKLKAILQQNYQISLANLERKPESEAQQKAVKSSLEDQKAKVDQDSELQWIAADLIKVIQENPTIAQAVRRAIGLEISEVKTKAIRFLQKIEAKGNATGVLIQHVEADELTFGGPITAEGGETTNPKN